MHYGPYAFAKDRSKPTIVKIKDTGGHIGQLRGFSETDLKQINLLYDCQSMYFFDFFILLISSYSTTASTIAKDVTYYILMYAA